MMLVGRRGYILVETLVAMTILSISALTIQGAIRQAILTRGQAQDYTTARFLLEKVMAERMLVFQQPEGSDSGAFAAPFDRFSYEWEVKRVEVPLPDKMPSDMLPDEFVAFKKQFNKYLGRLTAKISWSRAGMLFDASAETLMGPDFVWMPPEQPIPFAPGLPPAQGAPPV